MEYIYILTFIDGESVIDYGTREIIIGAYGTLVQAIRARANFAKCKGLIKSNEYCDILKTRKKTLHLEYGSLNIISVTIGIEQFISKEQQ